MAKEQFIVPKVKISKAAEQALSRTAPGGFNIPKTNGKTERVVGYMKTTQKTFTPKATKRK